MFNGKSTISMAISNSYVEVPEGTMFWGENSISPSYFAVNTAAWPSSLQAARNLQTASRELSVGFIHGVR